MDILSFNIFINKNCKCVIERLYGNQIFCEKSNEWITLNDEQIKTISYGKIEIDCLRSE
jgi:hypothetical protein